MSIFAQSPLGNFNLGYPGPLLPVTWYLLLLVAAVWLYMPKEKRPSIRLPRVQTATSVVTLLIISLLLGRAKSDRPDGNLHISIIDVGMGDAALIQSPSGRFVLINGGPSPITISDSLGRSLPLFSRNLDWLILTGTKEEQLGGLAEVIPRFSPSEVLIAGPPRTGAYRYLIDQLSEAGIHISNALTGQSLNLDDGCIIQVVSSNRQGAALLISYGNFRLLFAPSADPTLVESLSNLGSLRSVTAVLLPDGGSETVNPPEWLALIDPDLVLISVGAGNTRGLPSEAVLTAIEGRNTLRTDTEMAQLTLRRMVSGCG